MVHDSKKCAERAYKLRLRIQKVEQHEQMSQKEPMTTNAENLQYLSPNETAKLLGITARSVYNLIYTGVLKAAKLSSRMTMIRKEDIDRMLEVNPYQNKLIKENINDFLEKIEWEDVKKQYLTADELKRLAATPCDIDVLKRTSLFSCLTGLRISDILNIKWEDLEIAPDQGYCIRIRTQKAQTEAVLPISYEAIELCGEEYTGKVFKRLTRSMVNIH